MSNRTGGIMYAQVQTGAGSGLTWIYPFYYCLCLLYIFASISFYQEAQAFYLHSVFLFLISLYAMILSYVVTFKCSFILLVC